MQTPFLKAYLILLAILEHQIPYALFTKWNIEYFFARRLNYSTLSGTLGAKQLVVEARAKMFYGPISNIFFSNASTSVQR